MTEHTHIHGAHGHTHSHEHTRAVVNRLSRAIGHLEAVKRMAEEGRDCSELLVQLAAVRSALNATSRIILKDHIEHCIVDAVEHGDQETLDELNRAIDRMMQSGNFIESSRRNFRRLLFCAQTVENREKRGEAGVQLWQERVFTVTRYCVIVLPH